jgi:hypothetical protein
VADLQDLILAQQRAGFPDVVGARVAAFIPVSDRLLNEIIARELPAGAPVSDVSVEALPGNAIAVRARLARAPMLPAIKLTFTIVRQPQLPQDPVLVLRMGSSALMSLAGPALRFFDALPQGIRADGDLLLVNLRELLAARGADWLLPYLADLEITTGARALLVAFHVRVAEGAHAPPPPPE